MVQFGDFECYELQFKRCFEEEILGGDAPNYAMFCKDLK